MEINGTDYEVVVVKDHLEHITKAISNALASFTHGEAIALDFSELRPRGARTSGEGYSTGAASFVKTFGDMIKILANDHVKRYKPAAILVQSHQDFPEFKSLDTPAIILLPR